MEKACIQCGKVVKIVPARAETFKFCSYQCRGEWRKTHFTGDANPNWKGGTGYKTCQYCGEEFTHPILTTFKKMKFCSKPCADKGGKRLRGAENPLYREDARRRNRGGPQRKWHNAVVSRDNATCQKCGATGVELHAHHIKPYETHPHLRFEVSNGTTLCYRCHWEEHTAGNENGVNSGEPLTGKAEGNPEPSPDGNVREGLTTRGRAYRRWEGYCHECGKFLSRRLSDVKGKSAVFCDRACRGKWTSRMKQGNPRSHRFGSNSSTSALRESD